MPSVVEGAAECASREPAQRCCLVWNRSKLFLKDGTNVLGRTDGDVMIPSPHVSRRHALLVVKDGKACIEDLGSTNGTFVNGRRLGGPHALRCWDQIVLGTARVLFLQGSWAAEDAGAGGEPPADREADD